MLNLEKSKMNSKYCFWIFDKFEVGFIVIGFFLSFIPAYIFYKNDVWHMGFYNFVLGFIIAFMWVLFIAISPKEGSGPK